MKRELLIVVKANLPSSMVRDPALRGVGGHLLLLVAYKAPVLRRVSDEANGGDDEEGDTNVSIAQWGGDLKIRCKDRRI